MTEAKVDIHSVETNGDHLITKVAFSASRPDGHLITFTVYRLNNESDSSFEARVGAGHKEILHRALQVTEVRQ